MNSQTRFSVCHTSEVFADSPTRPTRFVKDASRLPRCPETLSGNDCDAGPKHFHGVALDVAIARSQSVIFSSTWSCTRCSRALMKAMTCKIEVTLTSVSAWYRGVAVAARPLSTMQSLPWSGFVSPAPEDPLTRADDRTLHSLT